jgi:hypothetical protein
MKRLVFAVLSLSLFVLAGCGGGGSERVVEVKGKILKGGQALKVDSTKLPPGDPGMIVRFVSQAKVGDNHSAKIDMATGNFTVPGKENRGIPPGSYKIEVQLGSFGKDEFKGKYSAEKTPITRVVEEGKEIVIDLDKPNG